jgi:type IVB pilus formation R64 PilN family outer membrane protein
MKLYQSVLMSILVSATLVGCAKNYYKDSKQAIHGTEDEMQFLAQQAKTPEPPVLVRNGYYVDSRPTLLARDPEWMSEHVSLRAQGMPLQSLVNQLVGSHNISVSYDATVNTNQPVTIDYQGTFKGALNLLASTLNYHFIEQGENEITWSAFEDRTFNISFMPGVSNYLVGESNNSSGHRGIHTGSGEGHLNSGGDVSALDDQQYNNLSAKLSVWEDLSKTLLQLKSPEGKVVVSESTTSVSVHDRPRQVAAIARYIDELNQNLSKEVLIKVKVLEIQLYQDFNFGIDWNIIAHALGTTFSLTGNMGTAANVVRDSMVLNSASNVASFGVGNGVQTLIKYLGEQGKVRVVTEPQVVTMNNQMGTIRITKNVGYIQSVSQTQNENFNTVSVTPGNVTDGFTLYVLPKIRGDKVYLQVSSTIAHLDKLEKMSTEPTSSSSSSSSSPSYQAIQLPTLSQKSFNQRSFVRSGSTLIMAGFQRMEDETKDASLFGVQDLGGKGAVTDHLETLVLLTPTIIENPESNVHANSK